jgi:ABC-2 type transport system ATP-binding protein
MILQGINLHIPDGCIYGYLGKNGAGKTTTLKLLLGLLDASEGNIFYGKAEFRKNRIKLLQTIGNIIEMPALYNHLTCYEQLQYMDYYYKKGKKKINEVLNIVGLSLQQNKKIKHCSTGMKQRLAIGIALYQDPDILILDEPVNGLDPIGIHDIRNIFFELHRMKKTILFSTHILSEVEKICTHIGILDKGKLLYQGEVSSLFTSCSKKLFIYLSNKEKAIEILTENQFNFYPKQENIICILIKNEIEYSKMIRLLIENAIEIYNIETINNTIEELFITLTSNNHV